MSEEINTQLSALMDGELPRESFRFLLRRVDHDKTLPADWLRYHLIRQVLRQQPILPLRANFASVVMARIDAKADGGMAPRMSWQRWVSGGAIAASVAVAALVVTRPITETGVKDLPLAAVNPPVITAPISMASTGAPAGLHAPSSSAVLPVQPAAATLGTDFLPSAAFGSGFEPYINRHYEAAGTTGQPVGVPYILLITPGQTASVVKPQNKTIQRQ